MPIRKEYSCWLQGLVRSALIGSRKPKESLLKQNKRNQEQAMLEPQEPNPAFHHDKNKTICKGLVLAVVIAGGSLGAARSLQGSPMIFVGSSSDWVYTQANISKRTWETRFLNMSETMPNPAHQNKLFITVASAHVHLVVKGLFTKFPRSHLKFSRNSSIT